MCLVVSLYLDLLLLLNHNTQAQDGRLVSPLYHWQSLSIPLLLDGDQLRRRFGRICE